MAFCNSCGTSLDPNAKFCPKCGATVPITTKVPVAAANPVPSVPASAPPPAQGGGAVKIILIVVAVIIGLGILGMATAGFVAWRIARHTHIEEKNGKVSVQSPFGTVETNNNAEEVAHDLGIDVYPGARPIHEGAADVHVGKMHTVSAEFETDDPPDKVADFYRSRMSNVNVNVSDNNHYTIVSTQKDSLITVNIEPQDGKTMIQIANVTGKGVAGDHSSD
jgi:zinc-ribbon domain